MKSSKGLSNTVRILSTIAMFAVVLVSLVVYRADILGLLLFFAFIVFYVLLPGLLIVRLCRFSAGHASADLLVSFLAGWSLVVFEYFITQATGPKIMLYALGPVLSALYICLIAGGKRGPLLIRKVSLADIPASFYLFMALLMCYVFMFTQFQYLSPEHTQSIYTSLDKTYQMSLIGSLSHGYPLVDPLVSGRIVHYHIFSQVLLAVPVMLFGMTPDFLVMSCTPYLTTALMGLSMYAMFRYFCKRQDRAGVYSLSFLLANVFIGRSISASYMFRMLLINENYAGFSAACFIAAVIVLSVYFRQTGTGQKAASVALLTVLTMLLTGIKAPLGLVLAGGLIGTFLLGIILRRVSFMEALMPTLLPSAGFFFVYQFLLALNGSNGVGGESIFGFGKIVGVCFWKSGVTKILKGMGIPSSLRLVIIMGLFLVVFFTIYALPFAIGYIRELILVVKGDKEYDFAKVTVYASAFVGFVAMMLLRYSGHSQVYFGVATLIFAPLIVFWFFEDKEDITSKAVSALFVLSKVWFFAVLILTTATLAMCYRDTFPTVMKHADPTSKYNKYKSMSAEEYESVKWIRENTPEDTLIATQMYKSMGDKGYSVENRWHHCHFLYAAYSVRNYYLEGSGYTFTDVEAEDRREMIKNTDKLYDPENEARGDDARELGVEYVMVTQKIYPTPDLSSADYEKVFSNKDVDIYKVR
ncbi:MAG: hypothetical protein IKG17_06215 [Mogibacterium sp.]|nr:hypothetical protein [Mogibacterium sp.]